MHKKNFRGAFFQRISFVFRRTDKPVLAAEAEKCASWKSRVFLQCVSLRVCNYVKCPLRRTSCFSVTIFDSRRRRSCFNVALIKNAAVPFFVAALDPDGAGRGLNLEQTACFSNVSTAHSIADNSAILEQARVCCLCLIKWPPVFSRFACAFLRNIY